MGHNWTNKRWAGHVQCGHDYGGSSKTDAKRQKQQFAFFYFRNKIPDFRRALDWVCVIVFCLLFSVSFCLSTLRLPPILLHFRPMLHIISLARASHALSVRCRSLLCASPYLKLTRPGSRVLFAVGIACSIKRLWICLPTAETNASVHWYLSTRSKRICLLLSQE